MATSFRRFCRRRHFVISCLALSVIVLFAVNTLSSNPVHMKSRVIQTTQKSRDPYIPPIRLVHIDLKGAPPKMQYLEQLFPILRQLGANGLLLEYEDMFPFEGIIDSIKAKNHYSVQQIQHLVQLAQNNGLHVIPLIQTFGHLEFILKLKQFLDLREIAAFPQAICPSNNSTWTIIEAMIDQVLSLHPNAKYLHIGCDEVYHLGLCPICRLKDRDQLFLSHVYKVAEYVVKKHGIIPIIWDDMLRQLSTDAIKDSKIADIGVEPMIWTYVKDIYRFVPESQFITYSQLFPNIWTASAFKGAFGETLTVPNIRMHLENNMAWIQVMNENLNKFQTIRGIAITGWQRYDHLATLCELLASSLPSLALNLISISAGSFNPQPVFSNFDLRMRCKPGQYYSSDSERALQLIDENDPNLFSRASECQFPGSDVFRLMLKHKEVIKMTTDYIYDVTIHKAWLTDYNIRNNISSPFRVDEALQEFSTVQYELQSLLRSAKEALSQVYDDFTVFEWIEQNIYPYLLKMDKLMNNSLALKRARVWPRRPLPISQDLEKRLNSYN